RVADGDRLNTADAVAASVGGGPGPVNDLGATAIVGGDIGVGDRGHAATILGSSCSRGAWRGAVAAFNRQVGRDGDCGRGDVAHGDGLRATDRVAALVGRGPQA